MKEKHCGRSGGGKQPGRVRGGAKKERRRKTGRERNKEEPVGAKVT